MFTRLIGPFAGYGLLSTFLMEEPDDGGADPKKPDPKPEPKDDPPEPKPSNEAAAAERLRKKAEKERDEALAKLKEREDAELDDKAKAEREAAEAKAGQKAAEERADKAEVKTRLLARAAAKTSSVQAAVDLSDSKLLDLKEASDEELDAHLDSVVKTYSLPGPGTDPAKPKPSASPAGGSPGDETVPPVPTPAEATGDPKKDYRTGIGVGILSMIRGGGREAPSGDEE